MEAFADIIDDIDEEDFDYDYDVADLIQKPIPEKKAEATIAAGTYAGTASMSMKALYKNIPKIDLPDQVEFIFEADIPKAALDAGKVIV